MWGFSLAMYALSPSCALSYIHVPSPPLLRLLSFALVLHLHVPTQSLALSLSLILSSFSVSFFAFNSHVRAFPSFVRPLPSLVLHPPPSFLRYLSQFAPRVACSDPHFFDSSLSHSLCCRNPPLFVRASAFYYLM